MRAWLRRMIREADHRAGRAAESVWGMVEEYLPGQATSHRDGTWVGDILERVWWEEREAARDKQSTRLRLAAR